MYSNDEYEQTKTSKNSSTGGFYQNNKLLVWIFIAIILIAIVVVLIKKNGDSTSSKTNVNKYSISIYPDNDITLSPGNSTRLVAIVKANANAKVTWASSDENVANVDNGVVKALKYGKSVITATYTHTDSKSYTAKKEITVADGKKDVALSDISLKDGSLAMPLSATYNIIVSPIPSDAYVFAKTLTSSNENVVKINDEGMVQAVSEGEANITVNINEGAIIRNLKVYVSNTYTNTEMILNPTKISLSKEINKIKVGGSAQIGYSVEPSEAKNTIVNWTSSNESVLKVDKSGIIEGIKEGMATIKIEALNGISDTLDVLVESELSQATDIQVPSDLYLEVGQSNIINPIIIPSEAQDKAITCTSANTAVATVDNMGQTCNVNGIKEGQTAITVKINSADITKTVNVIVSKSSGGSSSGGCGSYGSECNNSNKTCAAGKYCSCGKCVSCTAGYRCDGKTRTKCPTGYTSNAGSSYCTPQSCPAGQGANDPLVGGCATCGKGYYSGAGETKCTACPTGYTTSSSGATDKSACNVCASGYYKEGNTCNPCPKGYKCSNNIKTICPSGTFQDLESQSTCNPCPTGYTSIVKGAVSSTSCLYKSRGRCDQVSTLNRYELCFVPTNMECDAGSGYNTLNKYCNSSECSVKCRNRSS